MILYFSGTGNSKYVAEQIAKVTGDELISMNKLTREGKIGEFVSNTKPFVIVCPTYSWRIPKVVSELIKKSNFTGSKKVYFVVTCGSDTAKSYDYVKKLCDKKELELQGFAEVIMPENYIILFKDVSEESARETIKKADETIKKIAADIGIQKSFLVLAPSGVLGILKSGIVNASFNMFMLKSGGFKATDKCNGCSSCQKICPLNNIEMKNKKPAWGKNCTHCMACIGTCPKGAIEYKNKTQGKRRYLLSRVNKTK